MGKKARLKNYIHSKHVFLYKENNMDKQKVNKWQGFYMLCSRISSRWKA